MSQANSPPDGVQGPRADRTRWTLIEAAKTLRTQESR